MILLTPAVLMSNDHSPVAQVLALLVSQREQEKLGEIKTWRESERKKEEAYHIFSNQTNQTKGVKNSTDRLVTIKTLTWHLKVTKTS